MTTVKLTNQIKVFKHETHRNNQNHATMISNLLFADAIPRSL